MHRMYVQSSLAVKKSLAEICHFKSVKMVCRSLQILDPVLRKKEARVILQLFFFVLNGCKVLLF